VYVIPRSDSDIEVILADFDIGVNQDDIDIDVTGTMRAFAVIHALAHVSRPPRLLVAKAGLP